MVPMFNKLSSVELAEAEALWETFVTEFNLTAYDCDHMAKLFPVMFPDSEIAQKFCRSHEEKTPAIIIEVSLAPHIFVIADGGQTNLVDLDLHIDHFSSLF